MKNGAIPYLCGGTFLCQVLRARNDLATAAEHVKSKKENLSEQETFRRLISIYQLKDFYSDTSLKTYTSVYKSCKKSLTAYAQFTDSDLRLAFDSAVRAKDSLALWMMGDFVGEFINVKDKGVQLVRCLLGMIKDDESILPHDRFFILNGESVTKAELATMDDFVIEPFLLGVWHYIIMRRADKNEKGAYTYQSWYVGRNDYRGNVGNDINRNIIVKSIPLPSPLVEDDEVADKQPETEVINDYAGGARKGEQKSINQAVFINNGNGVQIGVNYGSLNFSSHKTS